MAALRARLAAPHSRLLLRRAFCSAAHPPGPPDPAPPSPPRRKLRGPHSRQHHETRVVPFTPEQLYGVVSDVNSYHRFVPWCTSSVVTRRVDDRHMVADLSVGFRLLSERYTSVITLDPNRAVSVDVPNSSLFDYLINDWAFSPTTAPSPHADAPRPATDLSFYVEFAFRNPIYQRVTDLFFEDVVKQMVSAFERECHRRYGAYTPQQARLPNRAHERERQECATPRNCDRHMLHRW